MAKKNNYLVILQRKNLVSASQIKEAQEMAQSASLRVRDALVRLGYVSSEDVTRAVAEEFGREYVDLATIVVPPAIIELVPESLARENALLPYQEDGDTLRVIVSDPNDIEALDKLRFVLNRTIEPLVAPKEMIQEAINRHYHQSISESTDSLIQEMTENTKVDFTETGSYSVHDITTGDSDAPIVKLCQMIIEDAVQLRASDIHVEPFEDRVRVRYRIDGILIERDLIPKRLQQAVISRFKILARLDIAERRRTQDGRIKLSTLDKELDLRVSVVPTAHGQSVVMRILDKDNIRVSLTQLGFDEKDFKKFNQLIRRPNGIILVTGPTGSGKTTSLYAALNDLNTPSRKIITAEDPVEYYLPGINQVEIKHSIGLDFARVIRAMLRQAPNIILVGEMRDLETAQMGIQASLTGHLVFSTLHTNDAPGAITRLVDMGVPPYLVSSSVIGIMAQRLIRTICAKCKKPYVPSELELREIGITPEQAAKATFMKGRGCGNCNKSGYRGRMAIFELMMMTPKIREMTFAQASTVEIRKAAVAEGMSTLYVDGIRKVLRGQSTVDEVVRVARNVDE